MKFRIAALVALAVFAGPLAVAWGHGVHGSVEQGPAVVVRFVYSGGEPLAYAQARVFGPGLKAEAFQNGRLDAEGRFAFVPARPGAWRIEVSDGMGHHAEKTVAVGDSPVEEAVSSKTAAGSSARILEVTLGLSLMVNLFFLVSRLKRRRPPAGGGDVGTP